MSDLIRYLAALGWEHAPRLDMFVDRKSGRRLSAMHLPALAARSETTADAVRELERWLDQAKPEVGPEAPAKARKASGPDYRPKLYGEEGHADP